jgi:hypothetical protein
MQMVKVCAAHIEAGLSRDCCTKWSEDWGWVTNNYAFAVKANKIRNWRLCK